MALFMDQVVTPPASLPVTVTDTALAAAVVEEVERLILWRAVVRQTRKIIIDGSLPARIELEPVNTITSLTRWTEEDDEEVIHDDEFSFVSRDPSGTIVVPLDGNGWPRPRRAVGSFALTYTAGWEVTAESAPGVGDGTNAVPPSVQSMISKAIAFRAGSGLGNISVGTLKLSVADSYSTDALPSAITNIARAWAYRPGIIAARP